MARHPQVDTNDSARLAYDSELLAVAQDAGNEVALEQRGAGAVPADHPRPADAHRVYPASHDTALQRTPNTLDLGQLRHAPILSRPTTTGRRLPYAGPGLYSPADDTYRERSFHV